MVGVRGSCVWALRLAAMQGMSQLLQRVVAWGGGLDVTAPIAS